MSFLDHRPSLPKDLPLLMHTLRSPPYVEACQLWYHCAFWENLTNQEQEVRPETKKQIIEDYGSIQNFKNCFISTSIAHFGSGWYVAGFHRHYRTSLRCLTYKNQETPMRHNHYPLLIIDLWEHTFARDYNSKKEYLEKVWKKINWDVVETRLVNSRQYIKEIEGCWM